MVKKIELSNSGYALVDDEDFEFLNQWVWRQEYGYVVRTTTLGVKHGNKKKKIRMHRQIMDFPEGKEVDHINRIRHDNRKENLRVCTHAENSKNLVKNKNLTTTSKYKGVSVKTGRNNWTVRIGVDGDVLQVGSFSNEEAAANAYNYYMKTLHGEYGNLNEVDVLMEKEEWEKHRVEKKRALIKSKYIGVSWNKRKEKWRAYIKHNYKEVHLGYFEDELEAAKVRDTYVIMNNLNHKLNNVLEDKDMKLIKFEKANCVPCQMVQNYLDDKGVEVEKVNPFDNPDKAVEYNISSVPVTILLDDNGNEVVRSNGFKPDELENLISQL